MSAQDIIAALPRLNRKELEIVDTRLHELLRADSTRAAATSWGTALLEVAGLAEDLPADFAHNHDHYLHGAPKR